MGKVKNSVWKTNMFIVFTHDSLPVLPLHWVHSFSVCLILNGWTNRIILSIRGFRPEPLIRQFNMQGSRTIWGSRSSLVAGVWWLSPSTLRMGARHPEYLIYPSIISVGDHSDLQFAHRSWFVWNQGSAISRSLATKDQSTRWNAAVVPPQPHI